MLKKLRQFLVVLVLACASFGASDDARAELAIYTLGDIDSYYAALNGVAMMFDDTGDPATESGLATQKNGQRILGPIMAIGLLISLLLVAISGVMKQELRLDQLLVSLILAYAMFIPRTTVLLEDIYSGQVKAVDNVPYGIALPGAVISTFTKTFSEKMETAFSVPAAQPLISGNTPGGFMDPLKILMTMRQINVCESNKGLCDSLFEYMRYCLADAGGNRVDINAVMKSTDPVTLLLSGTGVNGLTYYRSDYATASLFGFTPERLRDGVTLTCTQAGAAILADAEIYRTNGGQMNSLANDFSYALKQRKLGASAGTNVAPGSNDSGGVTARARLDSSFAGFQTASMLNDQKSAELSLLMRQPAIAAMVASSQADRNQAYNVFLTTAMHQYQVDAAADGTLFLKTMMPMMSILTFFFFAFSPIVAMMVMMMGLHSIKVIVSYLMFGIWTQSWMPGAVIVNYFIQLQFMGQLGGHGGSVKDAFISWQHQPDMFETLATNLAVGANMLAAVPVVMMSLMAGSAYGLSALADKIGSSRKGYFDEKAVAPDMGTATNAAAYQRTSSELGLTPHAGLPAVMPWHAQTMGQLKLNDMSQQSLSAATSAETSLRAQTQSSYGRLAEHAINNTAERRMSSGISESEGTTLQNTLQSSVQKAFGTETGSRFASQLRSASDMAMSVGFSAGMTAALPLFNAGRWAEGQRAFQSAYKDGAQSIMKGALDGIGIKGGQSASIAEDFATSASAKASESFNTGMGSSAANTKSIAAKRDALNSEAAGTLDRAGDAWQKMTSGNEGLAVLESASKSISGSLGTGMDFSVGVSDLYGRMGGQAGSGPTMAAIGSFAIGRAKGQGAAQESFAAGLGALASDPAKRGAFLGKLGEGMVSADPGVRALAKESYAELGSMSGTGGQLMSLPQIQLLRAGAAIDREGARIAGSVAKATNYNVADSKGIETSGVADTVKDAGHRADNHIDATQQNVESSQGRLAQNEAATAARMPQTQSALWGAAAGAAANVQQAGSGAVDAKRTSLFAAHNAAKNFAMDLLNHTSDIIAAGAGMLGSSKAGQMMENVRAAAEGRLPNPVAESAGTAGGARAPGTGPGAFRGPVTMEQVGPNTYGVSEGGAVARPEGQFNPGEGAPRGGAAPADAIPGEATRVPEAGEGRAGGAASGGGAPAESVVKRMAQSQIWGKMGNTIGFIGVSYEVFDTGRDVKNALGRGMYTEAGGVVAQAAASTLGAFVGGAAGGAAGTLVTPGVGTFVGGMVGGGAGYFAANSAFVSATGRDYRGDIRKQVESEGKATPGTVTPTERGEWNKVNPDAPK